jgi:hypothetical protein
MTSENDLNIIQLNREEAKEELPIPMDTKIEEEIVISSSDEPNAPEEEEERMNVEKPESDNEKEETKTEQLDAQPLLEQAVIIEGKRSRKPTLRLEISELVHAKKQLPIPQVNVMLLSQMPQHSYNR